MGPLSLFRYSLSFRCKDLIPGLKLFQSGVDGARLDLISLGQGEDNGFRSPVVYFTCEKGKETERVEGALCLSVTSYFIYDTDSEKNSNY